ncbi:alcohol dehydrogenase catalytic domain-containing protein [Falsiroseomonas sp. HW251]|uniref:alcohol dehydrogenase catalytic domain-containing protein n=1 Tax=Falsiroseomonas sp. HW251 TaxID=3390998 RepID=UPI003D310E53
MKAVVVRATGPAETALGIETLPDPAPGPGQVVLRVEACGVCFHDIVTRNGTLKTGVELPFIPGHEICGTIVAAGRDVRDARIGQRVATTQRGHVCGICRHCTQAREPLCAEAVFLGDAGLNGGYADYVVLDAGMVVPVPEGVAPEAAAIAACAIGTMFHATREVGRVAPGDTVLVTGAGGGLGMHGVQLARLAGARVLAQTTSPSKVAPLRDAGADDVVLHARGEDFSGAVRDLTAGEGADVVLDTVGTPLFQPTRRSLAKAGRWVLIGQLNGDFVPFNPAQLFLRGISLLSATSTTRAELRQVLSLLARGAIRAVLDRALPLAAAAEAHLIVEAGSAVGRVTLRPAA